MGVEELWYGREIVVAVLPLDNGSDAIKQFVDGGRRGQTNHKCFTTGDMLSKLVKLEHSAK